MCYVVPSLGPVLFANDCSADLEQTTWTCSYVWNQLDVFVWAAMYESQDYWVVLLISFNFHPQQLGRNRVRPDCGRGVKELKLGMF